MQTTTSIRTVRPEWTFVREPTPLFWYVLLHAVLEGSMLFVSCAVSLRGAAGIHLPVQKMLTFLLALPFGLFLRFLFMS